MTDDLPRYQIVFKTEHSWEQTACDAGLLVAGDQRRHKLVQSPFFSKNIVPLFVFPSVLKIEASRATANMKTVALSCHPVVAPV